MKSYSTQPSSDDVFVLFIRTRSCRIINCIGRTQVTHIWRRSEQRALRLSAVRDLNHMSEVVVVVLVRISFQHKNTECQAILNNSWVQVLEQREGVANCAF